MGRKFRGIDEWVVDATAKNIRDGKTSLDDLQAKNPTLAAAALEWDRALANSRAANQSFTFTRWDKDGVARVYVDGAAIPRECKVWFEAEVEETKEFDWKICRSGDWSETHTQTATPWIKIALRALELQGFMPDEVTFSTLIGLCRL